MFERLTKKAKKVMMYAQGKLKKVDRSKEIEETEEALNELDEINKFKIPKIDEKILEEKEADKTEDDNAMTKEELQEIYNLGYDFNGEFEDYRVIDEGIEIEDEEPMDPEYAKIYKTVNEALKGFFRPEFLNRLDEIIVFKPLTIEDVGKIAIIMLNQLTERVEEQGYTIEVDDLAKGILIKEGFDPIYGARPLRRAIMNLLEDKLAELFLTQKIKPGNHIHVTASDNRIKLKVQNASPVKVLVDEEALILRRLELEENPPERKFVNRDDYGIIYAIPEEPIESSEKLF